MNPSTLPCNSEALQLFLEEGLAPPEQIALEQHLDRCAACRAALDNMVASPQAWQDARLYLSDPAGGGDARSSIGDVESYRKLLGPTDDPRMLGRVGAYEIVGILGAGGMGVVFKGFDVSLNRFVAIKMLSPLLSGSGIAKQRFLREAQSAAAVIHDNVVAIHSIDQWQGAPYLVMTYIRGESLRSRLGRRGNLSLREVLRVGMQIAAGLAEAHSQGLIHRDIKPANILLETDVDRLKISDFGLARAVDDIRLTKSDMLLGTPQYMSPEQARDDPLDYRTDLFSLGSVLYEACAGRPPFNASTSYGVLRRIVECRPPAIRQLNPDVPDWLERLINRLMEKDREARFASAAQVETLLRQCLAHVEQPLLVSLPAAVSAPEPFRRRFSVQKGRLLMSVAALGVAALIGSLLFTQPGPVGRKQGDQEKAQEAAKPVAEFGSGDRPSTKAGNYKIEVLGVADVGGMTMTTTFDLSRMKVKQQFQSSSQSSSGGSVSGTAGGAGGGFGAKFLKPNLGIALKIEPLERETDRIVKLSSKARATDDRGEVIDAGDLGPSVLHFAEFEKRYPDSQALYLFQSARDAARLVRLDGELLVIPGRKLSVTFDGVKKQTKKADKDAFTLQSSNSGTEGIEITVAFPPTKAIRDARTPQEQFQAMVANRGSYSATIEDDAGEMHPFTSATNTGGSISSSFNLTGATAQGSVKSPDASTQTFGFRALPEGRSIKAIHVTFEDRTGEPKPVAFTLENIPLK